MSTENTDTAAATLEVVEGNSSASAKNVSSSVGNAEGDMSSAGALVVPIEAKLIAIPKYPRFEVLFGLYILRLAGAKAFPGVEKVGVNYTLRSVITTDAEADSKGIILLGVGENDEGRVRFNPEDGAVAKTIAVQLGAEEQFKLHRLIADAELARSHDVNLPVTMLSEIIASLPDYGVNNEQLLGWLWKAFGAMIAFERMPTDMSATEPTLSVFFDWWAAGRTGTYSEDVLKRLREQAASSLNTWRDNPTELAAIVHSFKATGSSDQEVLDWLTYVWDSTANNMTGAMLESERLAGIALETVNAERVDEAAAGKLRKEAEASNKKLRASDLPMIAKELKLLIVPNANKHTWKLARAKELDADLVVMLRQDGGFGMYLNRRNTRGFNLRPAIRMVRYLMLCRQGMAKEAELAWKQLGADGEYPGTEGVYFDGADNWIRYGTDREVLRTAQPFPKGDIVEIARACLRTTGVTMWRRQKRRMFDPRSDRGQRG